MIQRAGFSLIEIMLGLLIGSIGVLVLLQLFANYEGQRRTTTGSNDAQTNAAISFYEIERDIRQSGYGVSSFSLLGCDVLLRNGVTLSAMAPLTINSAAIPAGDANTDTLLIVYGNANGSSEGDGIIAQLSNTVYTVQTPTSHHGSDFVIAMPAIRPSPCSLTLDSVLSIVNSNMTVNIGSAGMLNGTLYNLGASPRIEVYAIRNEQLTLCDYVQNDCGLAANINDPTVWRPVASDIVSLRAQYGRDTAAGSMDGIVDLYDQTTPANACAWARVSSMRFVLVARNSNYEKTAVTAAPLAWAGSATNSIDLTANADWQNYRYKLLQTIVPIRNMAWLGVQAGC